MIRSLGLASDPLIRKIRPTAIARAGMVRPCDALFAGGHWARSQIIAGISKT